MRHGSPFTIVLTRSRLNVLISGGLVRLLRTLLVKIFTEREAEITNLPWIQTEKDNALARCRSGQRAWRAKKNLCFVLVLSLMKTVIPWTNDDESGRRFCECWRSIFKPGPETSPARKILRNVQKDPDDIRWTTDRTEFDELISLVKDSAPGPDGIPYGAFWCAGGLGSQFLFNANKYLLEGGTVPENFAERRTVFSPKTSDIDDNGRIIRSPDALRPLTLCNCDCKLLPSVEAFIGTP